MDIISMKCEIFSECVGEKNTAKCSTWNIFVFKVISSRKHAEFSI